MTPQTDAFRQLAALVAAASTDIPADPVALMQSGQVTVDGVTYQRFLCQTHLLQPGESISDVVERYLGPHVHAGDIVFISEKAVAITEGRLVHAASVRPRWVARLLSHHVRNHGYGMGLRQPVVMEMALREAGLVRILLSAALGGLTRTLGRSGDFYRLAGRRVAAIDGPNRYTVPPYAFYVVLSPANPERTSLHLGRQLRCDVAVVDTNDVGAVVLGASPSVNRETVEAALRDNPMGQGHQRTPMGILRPVAAPKRRHGSSTPGRLQLPGRDRRGNRRR